jgi:hypothetical protein
VHIAFRSIEHGTWYAALSRVGRDLAEVDCWNIKHDPTQYFFEDVYRADLPGTYILLCYGTREVRDILGSLNAWLWSQSPLVGN